MCVRVYKEEMKLKWKIIRRRRRRKRIIKKTAKTEFDGAVYTKKIINETIATTCYC